MIQLIGQVIEAAHRQGKRAAICGEMAADPEAAALLVGLGIDELSMNLGALPQLKQLIRRMEYRSLGELAKRAVGLELPTTVRAAIQEYFTAQ